MPVKKRNGAARKSVKAAAQGTIYPISSRAERSVARNKKGQFLRQYWRRMIFAFLSISALAVYLLNGSTTSKLANPRHLSDVFVGEKYEVLQVLPHDQTAFTQGLTYYNGRLYEGTGMEGESDLREINPEDGIAKRSVGMGGNYFGEGIAHYMGADGKEKIIQLTWKNRTGFIYDANTFDVEKEFIYETSNGEGWGITYNAKSKEFIVSDGSEFLFFWDRDTLKEKRRVEVLIPRLKNEGDNGMIWNRPLNHLNELEYLQEGGLVLANVWYQDVIVAIDPRNGHVVKVINFANLHRQRGLSEDCFNGIAISGSKGELYVTGKYWPHLYRVKLLDEDLQHIS